MRPRFKEEYDKNGLILQGGNVRDDILMRILQGGPDEWNRSKLEMEESKIDVMEGGEVKNRTLRSEGCGTRPVRLAGEKEKASQKPHP